jgi:hypothetical protein
MEANAGAHKCNCREGSEPDVISGERQTRIPTTGNRRWRAVLILSRTGD